MKVFSSFGVILSLALLELFHCAPLSADLDSKLDLLGKFKDEPAVRTHTLVGINVEGNTVNSQENLNHVVAALLPPNNFGSPYGMPNYPANGSPYNTQYAPQPAPQYPPQGAPQYLPQGAPQYTPQGAPQFTQHPIQLHPTQQPQAGSQNTQQWPQQATPVTSQVIQQPIQQCPPQLPQVNSQNTEQQPPEAALSLVQKVQPTRV